MPNETYRNPHLGFKPGKPYCITLFFTVIGTRFVADPNMMHPAMGKRLELRKNPRIAFYSNDKTGAVPIITKPGVTNSEFQRYFFYTA